MVSPSCLPADPSPCHLMGIGLGSTTATLPPWRGLAPELPGVLCLDLADSLESAGEEGGGGGGGARPTSPANTKAVSSFATVEKAQAHARILRGAGPRSPQCRLDSSRDVRAFAVGKPYWLGTAIALLSKAVWPKNTRRIAGWSL